MPTYVFGCSCGNIEEHNMAYQKRDSANIICDKCGKKMTHKFMPIGSIVKEGQCGNAKNKYSSPAAPKVS